MNDPTYPVEAYDELRTALRDGVERLIAERNRRRRTSRTLGIACAALLLLSGLALAATTFVGSPAPTSVQSDIAAVDAGMPPALQLNPDVRNAHSVASTGASTLWLADLAEHTRRNALRGNRGDAGDPGSHRKSEGRSRKIEADANQAGMAGIFRRRSKTMNVTREVVTNLLPIYFSGEASGDTKVLVEDYFRQDPDFERIARSSGNAARNHAGGRAHRGQQEKEKRDLESVLWGLRRRRGCSA